MKFQFLKLKLIILIQVKNNIRKNNKINYLGDIRNNIKGIENDEDNEINRINNYNYNEKMNQ